MTFTIPEHFSLPDHVDGIETVYIKLALEKFKGVKAHAAESLGISRTCLVMKIKRLESMGVTFTVGGINTQRLPSEATA
jgi:DNA-binding NtrC family response regulator